MNARGVITAKAAGRATITATSARNGKIRDTLRVFVVKKGSKRLAGIVVGLNPGHQKNRIRKRYPLAPGSKRRGDGCKVGCRGRVTGIREYQVTLLVALKLEKMLKKAGAKVVLTRRSNNVNLNNIQRANILNRADVDIALQLHCDSAESSRPEGLSVFYRTTGPWVAESRAMARRLAATVRSATGAKSRGVKVCNDYMSLNWSDTPAVLLEMGFLSNPREDRLLASDAYRKKVAKGIYNAICQYFGR